MGSKDGESSGTDGVTGSEHGLSITQSAQLVTDPLHHHATLTSAQLVTDPLLSAQRHYARDVSLADDVLEAEGEPLVREQALSPDGLHNGQGSRAEEEEEKEEEEGGMESSLQDHGWAWLVCLGSFYAHLLIGGFERSDGVLFLEFTSRFQQSAQLTAWPGALCSTFRMFMGPVSTAICNRFSVRTSVMGGSFVLATALFISGFATDITFLLFSFGLLEGIARGLVYSPSVIVVGLYFHQRRGLGTGLATAGVGLGTFIFPPLLEWLFQEFGFRGAYLILSGVGLNCCVVAALYRPLSVHRNIVLGRKRTSKREGEQALYSPVRNCDSHQPPKEGKADPNTERPEPWEQCQTTDVSGTQETTHHTPTSSGKKPKRTSCLMCTLQTCFPTESQRKDSAQRKLIEWSLLKNLPYLFFCLSISLFTAAFKSAFTFLPALAQSRGISTTQGAYLLSVTGVLDTMGRILSGWVLDLECLRPVRPLVYNGVIFVVVGLSLLSPWMTTFVQFAVLFGMYGAMTGCYVANKSVILVDILGQEKLSSSFGLLICFQGVGTLVGPPLSGLLKDMFGRFDEAFYLGGLLMALSGILMVVSNVFRVREKRHAMATEITITPLSERGLDITSPSPSPDTARRSKV